MAILSVESVSKQYPPPPRWARLLVKVASRTSVRAIDRVSFHVEVGEVVGLVGPNGAGKSTLMRLIAGLLEADSGRVLVAGKEVGVGRHGLTDLGLILEGDQGLYSRLTGRQNLEFFGVMSGLSRTISLQRAESLLELFGLRDRDKLVFGYSSGMRLRLSIARALIADPHLLLLDEPTRSLDPVASAETGELLKTMANDGQAVLVASHRLDEVVAVCDRVIALVEGQVRFDGLPSDLGSTGSSAQAALVELLTGTPTS